jgi:hypothetical protein
MHTLGSHRYCHMDLAMQFGKLVTNSWSLWPRVQLCGKYYHKFCTNRERERFKQIWWKTTTALPIFGPTFTLPLWIPWNKVLFRFLFIGSVCSVNDSLSLCLSLLPFIDFGFLEQLGTGTRIWLDGYDISRFGVEWDDLWPPGGTQQLTCFILLWYVHLWCAKRGFAFLFFSNWTSNFGPSPRPQMAWRLTYLSLVRRKNEWTEHTRRKREREREKEWTSMLQCPQLNFFTLHRDL